LWVGSREENATALTTMVKYPVSSVKKSIILNSNITNMT
jgi:hypothetical protein